MKQLWWNKALLCVLFEAQKCNFKSLCYDDEIGGKDAHKRVHDDGADFYGLNPIYRRSCLVESFGPSLIPGRKTAFHRSH